jgi:hypothetical protein
LGSKFCFKSTCYHSERQCLCHENENGAVQISRVGADGGGDVILEGVKKPMGKGGKLGRFYINIFPRGSSTHTCFLVAR